VEFIKVVLYYMLLVAVVNSPKRLRIFLYVLAFFIAVIATLTLLQYHNYIDLVALRPLQDLELQEDVAVKFARLRGPGVFYDPNDFCHILAVGCLIAFHGITDKRQLKRFAYLVMMGLMLYAIVLTQRAADARCSRVGCSCLARWREEDRDRPVLMLPPSFRHGRQFDMSTGDSTGQQRVQIWAEAFDMVRANPLWAAAKTSSNIHPATSRFVSPVLRGARFFGGTLFVARGG
jgi:hypothetical protein